MNKDAIRRAADWLEAHPKQHISGFYAATRDGMYTQSIEPDAECFCAIGRIAKELGVNPVEGVLSPDPETNRRTFYTTSGLNTEHFRQIVEINDALKERIEDGENSIPLWKGNPEVIDLLRKIAA